MKLPTPVDEAPGPPCEKIHRIQNIYCRSGDFREVFIFANFTRRTNSRNQESHKNYVYNSASK